MLTIERVNNYKLVVDNAFEETEKMIRQRKNSRRNEAMSFLPYRVLLMIMILYYSG